YDKLNGGEGEGLPTELTKRYPETQFEFTKRGEAGPDVRITGGKHPSEYPGSTWEKGKNYGDFKPDSPGGRRTFNSDQKKGKLPGDTQNIPYDPSTGHLK